jgi:hypothetical protein
MKSLLCYFRHFVSGFVLLVSCVSSFPVAAAENAPKKVVFLIGEQEYQTAETLPRFAREELISRGIDCQFAMVSDDDPNDFPGLNNLADADLLVVSVRRRTPPSAQMKRIKDYLDRGGAVMGIRTATHAFDREPPTSGHVRWEDFDNEVFGGDYQGHYGNKPPHDPRSHVSMTATGREHPILEGMGVSEFRSTAHLYRNRELATNTEVLLDGYVVGSEVREPVAWTYETKQGGRSFYTSLGDIEDFELRPFRLLLRNSIFWCLKKPVSGELVHEGAPSILSLDLTSRDATTGEVLAEVENLPSYRVGVVAIDMWNWHWCKTSTQRVAALVPRMNRVLEQARKMGVQVFWCPTDVINRYNGTHQREIAVATEGVSLPEVNLVDCPAARDGGGCTCGKERCRGNFGWDGMHPDLEIHRDDLMPNDPEVLYALCRQKGITHLIYMGVHTQACLLGKSVGVSNLLKAGMRCVLARDLTDAHGVYLPDEGFTPDDLTNEVIQHFETYLMPSINLRDTVSRAGMWEDDWLVDPVRMAPWGTDSRPHHFDQEELVTLTFPLMVGGEIYYTLDGSEPTRKSRRYLNPIRVLESTTIRSVVYSRTGKRSLEGKGRFVKRNAEPSNPDIHLSEIQPQIVRGPGHSASKEHFRLEPFMEGPKWDRSNRGGPLRLDGKEFSRGVGVHAVNQLVYALEPRYRRFVALAGIDEEMIGIHHGSNLARHSSVVFRVFVDGRLMAESPLMRVTEKPWRFNVGIPRGSRQISLVATDAGDGSKGDYADWVNAGFIIAK